MFLLLVGLYVCSLLLSFASSGMICLVSALYWNDSVYNRRRKDWMLMAVSTLAVNRLSSTFASVFARLLLSIDFFLQLNTARRGIRNNSVERPCVLPKLLWLSFKGMFSSLWSIRLALAVAMLWCCITISTYNCHRCRYDFLLFPVCINA